MLLVKFRNPAILCYSNSDLIWQPENEQSDISAATGRKRAKWHFWSRDPTVFYCAIVTFPMQDPFHICAIIHFYNDNIRAITTTSATGARDPCDSCDSVLYRASRRVPGPRRLPVALECKTRIFHSSFPATGFFPPVLVAVFHPNSLHTIPCRTCDRRNLHKLHSRLYSSHIHFWLRFSWCQPPSRHLAAPVALNSVTWQSQLERFSGQLTQPTA
jgi:hypothetical protein